MGEKYITPGDFPLMRRASRVDNNQALIDETAIKAGATIAKLSHVGKGFPDRLYGFHGINYLVEIKNPDAKPSDQKLTDDQQKFHLDWRGQKAIIRTPLELLRLFGVYR